MTVDCSTFLIYGHLGHALTFVENAVADAVEEKASIEPVQLTLKVAGLVNGATSRIVLSHDPMWAIEPPVFHAVTKDWASAPMVVSGRISVKKPVLGFDESKAGVELQD